MKKLISIIISISMLLGLCPLVSFAETSEPSYSDGEYIITNEAELMWFSENFKSGESENARLTADIDLADSAWTPIGTSSTQYSGSFDGEGHTISGLSISSAENNVGLFGYIGADGSVLNLNIMGSVASTGSSANTGAVAGYNEGNIENCSSSAAVSGKYRTGGIAGYNSGTISKCINNGEIGNGSTACSSIGGIAGYNKTPGSIVLSVNTGTVTNSGSYKYTGGIAGTMDGTGSKIENTCNTGTLSGSNYVGGLVGFINNGITGITNSYSTGIINCTGTYKGGLAIPPMSSTTTIIKKITNCYFLQTDTVNSGLYAVQKATYDREDLCAKTEEELKSAELLAALGEAFVADTANTNNGYPILAWQKVVVTYNAVITVSPANAALTLVNSDNEEIDGEYSDGVYTFNNLDLGTYSYTASCNEGNYIPRSGSFTIEDADYSDTVTLEKNKYNFKVTVDGKLMTSDSVNANAGEHKVALDYSKVIEGIENAMLIKAVYNADGAVKYVSQIGESYTDSADYNLQSGEVIKIFLWDGDYIPKEEMMKIQAE